MATRKPPRRDDNLARPCESQIQSGRAFFGAPWERGRGKGFFEVHHARGEAAVKDPGNTTKSGREVADGKPMDLLPFRHREDAKGGRGDHAEGPFRSDEKTLQVQPRRRSCRGPRLHDGPVGEHHLETEHLVSHRAAEIASISDAVRPDGPAQGCARSRPRVVAEDEPSLPEAAVQRLEDDPRFHGRGVCGGINRTDSAHPPHIQDNRIRRRPCAAHQARATTPRDNREACACREPNNRDNVLRGTRPGDRRGSDAGFRETGPPMSSEGVQVVSGRNGGARGKLIRAKPLREFRKARSHGAGTAWTYSTPRRVTRARSSKACTPSGGGVDIRCSRGGPEFSFPGDRSRSPCRTSAW